MRFVHILVGSVDQSSVNGVNKVVRWLAATQTRLVLSCEIWMITPRACYVF